MIREPHDDISRPAPAGGAAAMAGLRAQSRHYDTVARAIDFIRAHARRQPGLDEIAAAVHLSPHHLQRLFAEWAGISPKRFLQYLTKEYARARLLDSGDTLSVALESGLSGPGRLHDLMVGCEAMTPAEIRAGGLGITVGYGFGPTPFGEALVAWTSRGVCHFAFRTATDPAMIVALASQWPRAELARDDARAGRLLQEIFGGGPRRAPIPLHLRGTNFQIKVWEALIRVDIGELVSYRQLAAAAGAPRAQRAVGSALAANAIGYLIPCHRVIREGGDTGSYRWGAERKLVMLGWEAAQSR
jgi:AraC family transcriptional regulator of adaptative response/methylated-DNA-[protein]-cysteine methyltransferase